MYGIASKYEIIKNVRTVQPGEGIVEKGTSEVYRTIQWCRKGEKLSLFIQTQKGGEFKRTIIS